MRRQKQISVDTETTHIWPRWAEIVGISLSWNEKQAYYLPLRGPQGARLLDPQPTLDALRPVLEDAAIGKLGQNLKYDRIVLRNAGIELAGTPFDTMVASYLLDAGQRNHNLDDLAKRYLRHVTIKIEELIGSGKHQKRMDEVPIPQITDYAAEDALVPVRLQPILARRMEEESLVPLFRDVEMPLIDVLVELEYNGVKIDVGRLAELSGNFGEQMQRLEQEIYLLAGRQFNIASPRQLQEVLFVEQKLPVIKRTAKTGPSTDVDVLEELALQASLTGEDRRISAIRQAEGDLRRCAAADGPSADRAGACLVQPGGHGHGAAQLARSQLAEHPRADRGRPRDPLGLRPLRRAGRWWRPTIRRSNCGSWRITRPTSGCARHSSATRTFTPAWPARSTTSLGAGNRRHAPPGKGGELRHDLWPGRGWPFAAVGHPPRDGQEVHRQLLRDLSRHRAVLDRVAGRVPQQAT